MADNCEVPGKMGEFCRNAPEVACILEEQIEVAIREMGPELALSICEGPTYEGCPHRIAIGKRIVAEINKRKSTEE